MNIEDVLKGHGVGIGGGSNIKSIQRGEITPTPELEATININPVNINNSCILISYSSSTVDVSFIYLFLWHGYFANSSQIKLRTDFPYGYGGYSKIYWQVIEFQKVKSIQRGSVVLNSTSVSRSITPVNMNKSILFFDVTSKAQSKPIFQNVFTSGGITNSNMLTFTQLETSLNKTAYYTVVEFD